MGTKNERAKWRVQDQLDKSEEEEEETERYIDVQTVSLPDKLDVSLFQWAT